ncbi:MAG TPA: isoleucine--tRNA ligase [Verrucomicrobiae bacterium]|nr:isoleucine--tRNA ligase [Verrucomicrobiae bacterium]
MFDELKEGFSFPKIEAEVLEFWRKNKVFEKTLERSAGRPDFVFYEGPPTANGKPGIHHVISRTIKDLVCRYKTMQGYRVERKAGWDTHGLPVELEVEKELGLNSKAKIEEYGIEKFNAKCRESVFRYKKEWDELTERIGYWLDLENPYITFKNEYIESVWWILAQYFRRGLIYRGFRVVPYCPRCGTGLSSHEVAQGYEDVTETSIYVKFRLKDQKDTFILSWTTTPWTLPGNVALAVGEGIDYVKVKQGSEFYWLAEARLGILKDECEIVERKKGKDLAGLGYEPLFAYINPEGKPAFLVATADFVTTEEGTGVVHTAVMYGADDYTLGESLGLPKVHTVDDAGRFKEFVTDFAGKFVKDAEVDIIKNLKSRGLLYKTEKYTHSYPFCWRCDSPLLYYARPSWYIKTSQFREAMIRANQTIKWYPPEIGAGRFGEWLAGNVDWALSRERYWGTPLPIWVCEGCKKEISVESLAELRKLSGQKLENLDLHRPFVDAVEFPCTGCKKPMRRTPEVIDVWFDSGAMPVAQWHYPFENKEKFEKFFPADFISEAVDQTRGWFYSLLAISVLLFDKSPYKSVVVAEFILDKEGQKMSKHKGNVVDPWEVVNKYGADPLRWYLISVSAPWLPTRFDVDGVVDTVRNFFDTLRNTYSFFALYANIDGWTPEKLSAPQSPSELDRWILSRLNSLVKETTADYEVFEVTNVARKLERFVVEELSNWYVRRNRKRFWRSGWDADKASAYATLHQALVTVLKLAAPMAPFLPEKLYQELAAKFQPGVDSIHWAAFPVCDESKIDGALERKMDDLIQLVVLGRAARNKSKIKVRQPLPELIAVVPGGKSEAALSELVPIMAEELNVKKVTFLPSSEKLFSLSAKPVFSVLGPKWGKKIGAAAEKIKSLGTAELLRLKQKGELEVVIEGEAATVSRTEVEIVEKSPEGLVGETFGGYAVALDTRLSEDLVLEGLARELVNRIQNLRKESGFEVTDRIWLSIEGTPAVAKALERFGGYIRKETLTERLSERLPKAEASVELNVNGEKVKLSAARAGRPENVTS